MPTEGLPVRAHAVVDEVGATDSSAPLAERIDLVAAIPRPRPSGSTPTTGASGETGLSVLGVRVDVLDRAEALERAGELMTDRTRSARLVYVNAACLNISARHARYREILDESDVVLNDGIGLDIAARLQGARFPTNLCGTDFSREVLGVAAGRGARVYLLGGAPGVAAAAADNLRRAVPGVEIVGTHHGYQDSASETAAVVDDIRERRTDLLVVGMGVPRQELWLDEHLDATGARLGMAVGAFIDLSAGSITRAPRWVRRARMEWGFRLCQEPRRLFKRYVLGNPAFLVRVLARRSSDRLCSEYSLERRRIRCSGGQRSADLTVTRRHERPAR